MGIKSIFKAEIIVPSMIAIIGIGIAYSQLERHNTLDRHSAFEERIQSLVEQIDESKTLSEQKINLICDIFSHQLSTSEIKGRFLKQLLLSELDEISYQKLHNRCDYSNSKITWNKNDYDSYFYSKRNTKKINLVNVNIENSIINNCFFQKTNFNESNLTNSSLLDGIYKESSFYKANLKNCTITNSDFTDSNLQKSNLENVNFDNTNLIHADFRYTDLRKIDGNFKNAMVWGIKLDNAKVSSTNWINNLSESTIGRKYIREHYFVDNQIKENEYFLVKKKKNLNNKKKYQVLENPIYKPFKRNNRIKFKVDYPSNLFTNIKSSDNGDGYVFLSDDENFEISIYGTNYIGSDIDDVIDTLSEEKIITYKKTFDTKGSGYLSGYTNNKRNKIFYSIILVEKNNDFEYTVFWIEYPTIYKTKFQEIFEVIRKSFSTY